MASIGAIKQHMTKGTRGIQGLKEDRSTRRDPAVGSHKFLREAAGKGPGIMHKKFGVRSESG